MPVEHKFRNLSHFVLFNLENKNVVGKVMCITAVSFIKYSVDVKYINAIISVLKSGLLLNEGREKWRQQNLDLRSH